MDEITEDQAREALRSLLAGDYSLHVPPQDGDPDLVLSRFISAAEADRSEVQACHGLLDAVAQLCGARWGVEGGYRPIHDTVGEVVQERDALRVRVAELEAELETARRHRDTWKRMAKRMHGQRPTLPPKVAPSDVLTRLLDFIESDEEAP